MKLQIVIFMWLHKLALAYHDYEYQYEPIWFRVESNGAYLDAKMSCLGSEVVGKGLVESETQLWRWHKGLLINKSNGMVLDIASADKDKNKGILFYGRHSENQCFKAVKLQKKENEYKLANCFDQDLHLVLENGSQVYLTRGEGSTVTFKFPPVDPW
ncbi:hypothetical protein CHUAL_003586 [Chamberlinius hualienensis]